MDALRDVDQVAYVRFASVYRSFEDIDAFRTEVERLERRNRSRPAPPPAEDGPLALPAAPAAPGGGRPASAPVRSRRRTAPSLRDSSGPRQSSLRRGSCQRGVPMFDY